MTGCLKKGSREAHGLLDFQRARSRPRRKNKPYECPKEVGTLRMENKVLKRSNQKTLASLCLAPGPRTLPRDGQKQQTETVWSSKASQLICGIVNWGRGCLGGRGFCHIGGILADVIKDIWQLGPTPSILGLWMRLWTYLKPKGLLFFFCQTYDFINGGKSQHGHSLHHTDSTPLPCSGL